ncbi:MAG: alkaline phosphatase family protein [Planctomycetes bacterium]|nr:alkaline phosphatase family protein [Planctomycetota bacterium]
MKPVCVLDVVGLTPGQIGERTPNLRALARRGVSAPMGAILPAVTASAQATMLTGLRPSQHGAVGNGWFYRDQGEVWLWRQANALVGGEKLYERARRIDPNFTCAKLFWWWNMGARVTHSLTPKPFYPADGRKILAIYGTPRGFEDEVEKELGKFPFFDFWGPKSGLASSRWIADAAIRTLASQRPDLTLVYLPHLDYDHQRYGPDAPRSLDALTEVDQLVGDIALQADKTGAELVVVSEYGIEKATGVIHINRALREAGWLVVRQTPVGEVLDTFASRAFAVADHQVAHVYLRDELPREEVRKVVASLPGVAAVLEGDTRREAGLDHARAGDLVCVAGEGAWFTYYYWIDESRAPDFAPTVDIHRKPGYDPCELFVDPALAIPQLRVARRLAQKMAGMRYLMDVIPLDPSIVGGTHGRIVENEDDGPVFLCSADWGQCGGEPQGGKVAMTSVCERVLGLLQR